MPLYGFHEMEQKVQALKPFHSCFLALLCFYKRNGGQVRCLLKRMNSLAPLKHQQTRNDAINSPFNAVLSCLSSNPSRCPWRHGTCETSRSRASRSCAKSSAIHEVSDVETHWTLVFCFWTSGNVWRFLENQRSWVRKTLCRDFGRGLVTIPGFPNDFLGRFFFPP